DRGRRPTPIATAAIRRATSAERGHREVLPQLVSFTHRLQWKETSMPEKKTLEHALKDKREGKSPSTHAGEFVKEEMAHIREGKHGARSTKQAIAIGPSKA